MVAGLVVVITDKQQAIETFEAKRSDSDVVSNSDQTESISGGITR
jgi:hypothetical protein